MAASAALDLGLCIGAAGSLANSRAEHFELVVQGLVDRSRWAPSCELRGLRGRTLRLSGRAITDVDAIGGLGDVLLIVSAKSRVFTEALARGDYSALRNAVDLLVSACNEARDLMDLLVRVPRGDNYDFMSYRSIMVPVCTPQVLWTPLGVATSELASGLRAALALEELRVFLGTR